MRRGEPIRRHLRRQEDAAKANEVQKSEGVEISSGPSGVAIQVLAPPEVADRRAWVGVVTVEAGACGWSAGVFTPGQGTAARYVRNPSNPNQWIEGETAFTFFNSVPQPIPANAEHLVQFKYADGVRWADVAPCAVPEEE